MKRANAILAIEAIAAALVISAGMAGPARAAELCVSCTGPDAVYACQIEGAGTAVDPRLSLYCITELAKTGGHASCSVERAKAAPCEGEKKQLANPVSIPAENESPAPDAASAAETAEPVPAAPAKPAQPLAATDAPVPPPPAGQPAVTEIPKTNGPPKSVEGLKPVDEPKTVEEMVKKGTETAGKELQDGGKAAGEAVQTAGGALSKAGKAVGDAAKKTWTCITSLFGSC